MNVCYHDHTDCMTLPAKEASYSCMRWLKTQRDLRMGRQWVSRVFTMPSSLHVKKNIFQ